jgi:hypothetical protein
MLNKQVLQCLLDNGSDQSVKTGKGKSVWDVAHDSVKSMLD